jgi:hypothetical protein
VDLGGDEVIVVEDPLRRRRGELAAMDVPGQGPVRPFEEARILLEPRDAAARRAPRVGIDGEARGQGPGALLEQLDAQQLVAEGLVEGRRGAAGEVLADQGVTIQRQVDWRVSSALRAIAAMSSSR